MNNTIDEYDKNGIKKVRKRQSLYDCHIIHDNICKLWRQA